MSISKQPAAVVDARVRAAAAMATATYSESESDRTVLAFRGPDGEAATVIIMRRGSKVWVVFNGAVKTTVALTDPQAEELIDAVRAASRGL